VEKFDSFSDAKRDQLQKRLELISDPPLVSLIMPVWNPDLSALRAALESIVKQVYPRWELCIADDASTRTGVQELLSEFASDARIKLMRLEQQGGISRASNSALSQAQGEFIGLVDHDDVLAPHALAEVVLALAQKPEADLVYSDEDKLNSQGQRCEPHFKTDYNPELLRSVNYLCHFVVIRASLVKGIQGFRSEFDGAQDWDLFLRVIETSDITRIIHIPKVLYHWRMSPHSTASGTAAKPGVLEKQRMVVEQHLQRARVAFTRVSIEERTATIRTHYSLPSPAPKVSIIIPTRDRLSVLKPCVDSLVSVTRYPRFEIVIVDTDSSEPETTRYLANLGKQAGVRVLRKPGSFNFSDLNNYAVAHCDSEVIALLNNDIEAIHPEWLQEMVALAVQSEVGAVGARLLYPNKRVQHVGVILGIGGVAGHPFRGATSSDPGYMKRTLLPQDLSAVTAACLVMRKSVFEEVKGFDQDHLPVAFNDTDLCLKIRAAGYRVVYNPYAELIHHESVSRGYEDTPEKQARFNAEVQVMRSRWTVLLDRDPFFNPNFSLHSEHFELACPPRT